MALDVWVGRPGRLGSKLMVSFEPDAYYAFLSPLFEEFAQAHGRWIDPYEGTSFEPEGLAPVFALIAQAEARVAAQAEEFDVHVGTDIGSFHEPANEELYETVQRARYLEFIRVWRSAAELAQRARKPLVFWGD